MLLLFRYPYLQLLLSPLLQKHRKYHGLGWVCGLPFFANMCGLAPRARAVCVSFWGRVWRARARGAQQQQTTTSTTTTTTPAAAAAAAPATTTTTTTTTKTHQKPATATQHELTLSSPALPVGALALEYCICKNLWAISSFPSSCFFALKNHPTKSTQPTAPGSGRASQLHLWALEPINFNPWICWVLGGNLFFVVKTKSLPKSFSTKKCGCFFCCFFLKNQLINFQKNHKSS